MTKFTELETLDELARLRHIDDWMDMPEEDWVFRKFEKDLHYLTEQQRELLFKKHTDVLVEMIECYVEIR